MKRIHNSHVNRAGFGFFLLEKINQKYPLNGRVPLEEIYTSFCPVHRLPKEILRAELISLERQGFVKIAFVAHNPNLSIKR